MPLPPAWKPVLLSALVMPGAGQLALGERLKAAFYAVGTLGALGILFVRLVRTVLESLPPDLNPTDVSRTWQISLEIQRKVTGELTWPLALLLVLWAASIVDAWIVSIRRAKSEPKVG